MHNHTAGLRLLVLPFTALLVLMSVSSAAADRLTVYTVNYPLMYFAERIGGERIEVHFPAPPDVDPAFWVPDAVTVAAYQQADLIILNGANYAKWVNRVSLPRLSIVDTSSAFADRLITEEGRVTHSHGPGGDHSHYGAAFTTWLDFNQALQQAEAILVALQRKRPEDSEYFDANFVKLEQDLQALDADMLALAEKATDRRFMASHPVYQYLARRYRLDLGVMSWEPEVYPGQAEWQRFSQMLRERPARWMLWEGKPLDETAQKLAEMGVSIVVFAPCMNVPEKGDFLTVMQQNVAQIPGTVYLFPQGADLLTSRSKNSHRLFREERYGKNCSGGIARLSASCHPAWQSQAACLF